MRVRDEDGKRDTQTESMIYVIFKKRNLAEGLDHLFRATMGFVEEGNNGGRRQRRRSNPVGGEGR